MSNNGWIKYSEEKPKCHGEYLVVRFHRVHVGTYITQDDIREYNALYEQITQLERELRCESDREKARAICNERSDLYEQLDYYTYIGSISPNIHDFKEEGFYNLVDDSDGFEEWIKMSVEYWQPLPELPTE